MESILRTGFTFGALKGISIMKSFTEIFDIDHPSIQQFQKKIAENITARKVSKGTILQMQGELPTKVFLVKKGVLRSYTIDDNGKEHIFMFAPEGWLVSDMESQYSEEPAQLFIDVVENAEIEILDRQVMVELQLQESLLPISIDKLIKRVGVLQRRVIMLMSMSAQKRYEHFLETYPDIPNRVPQKMIASYLGVTPEALSKIRGNMVRKS